MKRIFYHHGSPGFPDEWDHLWGNLSHLPVEKVDRYRSQIPPACDGDLIIGYSFGAYLALQQASRLKKGSVIAVCPYWQVTSKPFHALLASLPIASSILLPRLAPKSLQEFARKSCAPHNPPDLFQKLIDKMLQHPDVIRRSLLEKNNIKPVEQLLRDLSPELKISLVFGEKDEIAPMTSQWSQLLKSNHIKESFPKATIIRISGAGHGLPWTHTKELTQSLQEILDSIQ